MRWDYVLGKFFNMLNTHCICLRESLSLKENWHAIDVFGKRVKSLISDDTER